ncbi:MAG: hypothetical protein KDA96_14750 [Planctomycetaceae bacterium]|nr:hypothetical protein [Planctomycetaceae bacterium]
MTQLTDDSRVLGQGDWRYEPVIDWPQVPAEINLIEAIGVTVGADDRVYVFNRGHPAVLVFEPSGQFVTAWGENDFVRPHGMTAAADGSLYLTDDLGHRVAQYSAAGVLLRNVGPFGVASDTDAEGFDYRTIRTAAGPFNLPTNVGIAANGGLFVTDGYGNARVHHFDADGTLLSSWGAPGAGPGEFNVPHGICIDARGRVLVADRENSRIQIFDQSGTLLDLWTDVVRPCDVFWSPDNVYFVAELGNQNGRYPWQPLPESPVGGRVSIFDSDGRLLSRWGGGLNARRPDGFYACHDIAVDSQRSIYVGEVAVTAAMAAGEDPTGLPTLRKFVHVSGMPGIQATADQRQS